MAVTINDPFKSSPRISEDKFVAVLQEVGSFAVDALWMPTAVIGRPNEARRIYQLIVSKGHDPGVWLGITLKEHRAGTDKNSVLWRINSHSWTNARTVRHPDLKATANAIYDTERKSNYVRYASVYDSVLDGIYRVDEPGFAYRKASATSILEHIRIWAPDKDGNKSANYAETMAGWINQWRATDSGAVPQPKEEPPVSEAQIPGFRWNPADRDHYQPGRTARIRGGAQHFTAGSNSLNWLSTTPGTQVSATFLVKHNPTLEDRGWQIVKIEDTAWTTAFANPYTVSIEFEHREGETISDAAYAVLAQTWRDISEYVARNNLGSITPDTSSLKGHKDWVGNPGLKCPDGIDVGRIVQEWKALLTTSDSLVIAGNPYDAKLVFGFRSTFLKVGAAIYPSDPVAGGLAVFGFATEDEQATSYGARQIFERVVLKWHRGAPPPFDIVVALRNEPLDEAG